MDSTKDSQCLEVEDGLSAKCYSSCRYLLSVNHTKTRPQEEGPVSWLNAEQGYPCH